MLKDVDQKPTTESESSALASRGFEHEGDKQNNEQSEKPWCDYYKWSWHTRETCWKIHGKRQNLNKKSSNEGCAFQVNGDD